MAMEMYTGEVVAIKRSEQGVRGGRPRGGWAGRENLARIRHGKLSMPYHACTLRSPGYGVKDMFAFCGVVVHARDI